MRLSLLSHLPLRVATNQLVMVKDNLCQTPTNHCSIIDAPRPKLPRMEPQRITVDKLKRKNFQT